jgi:[NiFe] hydrogenase assembly HybE family chaperone
MNEDAIAIGARIAEIYRQVYARTMNDAPICNAALDVESVGFRALGACALGVVVTPWFMNVVLAPRSGGALPAATSGATRQVALPAGRVDFLATVLDGFGPLWTCSLFSPMHDFADQDSARATAQEALAELLRAPQEQPTTRVAARNRRALLFGRTSAGAAP